MSDCDCLPCQWRRQRLHPHAPPPCIYSGPHGLRRPGDPSSPAQLAQTARARAAVGLIRPMTLDEQIAYRATTGSWWPITPAEHAAHDAETDRLWDEHRYRVENTDPD